MCLGRCSSGRDAWSHLEGWVGVSQAHLGEVEICEYICRGLKEEGGAWTTGREWEGCRLNFRSGLLWCHSIRVT